VQALAAISSLASPLGLQTSPCVSFWLAESQQIRSHPGLWSRTFYLSEMYSISV
jgi:hypothetical protein